MTEEQLKKVITDRKQREALFKEFKDYFYSWYPHSCVSIDDHFDHPYFVASVTIHVRMYCHGNRIEWNHSISLFDLERGVSEQDGLKYYIVHRFNKDLMEYMKDKENGGANNEKG